MTTLILVRHGQSTGNLLNSYNGHIDYPLSPVGLVQAEQVARYLKDHYPIDVIYSSDLSRAVQTAEPTAKAFGLKTVSTPELRELCAGVWEGRDVDELQAAYPDLHEAWKDGQDIAPEGGESHPQIRRRVGAFINRVTEEYKGGCIACFAHWGPVYHICHHFLNANPVLKETFPKEIQIKNTSITVVLLDDCGVPLRFEKIGYDGHLAGGGTATKKGVI